MERNKDINSKIKRIIADNWECAQALEVFKQTIVDPLQERMDKNHTFLFEGGYEEQCRKNKVKPDYEYIEKLKKIYNENVILLRSYVDIYVAAYVLTARHEGVINELARVYVGLRDKVLWKAKMPAKLLPEQQEFMDDYFQSIQTILEPCGLDHKT